MVAFGIILIVSTFQWFVDGRKNFVGPRIDVDVISGELSAGGDTIEESSRQEQGKSEEK